MVLAMIENHAVSHVETTQQLRYHEDVRAALAALPADALPEERASAIAGVKELTLDEVVEEYAGARKWVKLHQQLVEHFASVDGFSTQAVVSMAKAQLQGQHLPESSIKAV